MAKITIDKDKCKGCLLCIGACPKGLIVLGAELNPKGIKPVKFKDDAALCAGCAMCAVMCPDCCIEVFK